MPIKINGINHFAISVADMEESIKWYNEKFGFTVIDRSEIPGEGVKVAHMQGVGFILEIFCAPHSNPLPPDRREPNLDFRTQGNKHISFGVKDGRKTKAEMEAMRGFGISVAPALTAVVCICVTRIFWMMLIFPARPEFSTILFVYPVSLALNAAAVGLA